MSCPEYRMPPQAYVWAEVGQSRTSPLVNVIHFNIPKEKLWLVAAVMRHFVLTGIFPFLPLPFRH